MFTGPVGPVDVFFYWPEAVLGVLLLLPGASGSLLAASPALQLGSLMILKKLCRHLKAKKA